MEELVLDTSDRSLAAESPDFGFQPDQLPFCISRASGTGSLRNGHLTPLQSTEQARNPVDGRQRTRCGR